MEKSADVVCAKSGFRGRKNVNEGSAKLSFVITSDKFTFNGPCDGFSLGGTFLSAYAIL